MKVLIVDDDPSICLLFATSCKSAGVESVIAADGVSALSELTAESFDLIITDNEMPQMDGVELCRRVRLDERHRLTLIILCSSALARLDTEALKHDIKAIRFLEKPLKLEFLVELFRTLAAHSN